VTDPVWHRRVAAVLDAALIVAASHGLDIEGAVKLCGPKGKNHYDLAGSTKNRQGSRLTLDFGLDSMVAGKHPDEIEGTWDGEDLLKLRTRLYTVDPDDVVRGRAPRKARQDGSDDRTGIIQFELRRSTEEVFEAAC
jgi:hypothetical protein